MGTRRNERYFSDDDKHIGGLPHMHSLDVTASLHFGGLTLESITKEAARSRAGVPYALAFIHICPVSATIPQFS